MSPSKRHLTLAVLAIVLLLLVASVSAAGFASPDAALSPSLAPNQQISDSLPASGRAQTLAGTPAPAEQADDFRSSPVMLIENTGQWEVGARFQVWGGTDGTMWLAEDAIWITVMEPEVRDQKSEIRDQRPDEFLDRMPDDSPRSGVNIKLSFPGANPHPTIETFDRLDTTISYFYGNDPNQWRPDVPVWDGVRYVDLWPGVDLEVGSEDGRLVQRFVAREGADVSGVRLLVEGADEVSLERGWLNLLIHMRELALSLPHADFSYQVESLDADGLVDTFGISPKDIAREIDAQTVSVLTDNPDDLLYSTFLGGSGTDLGYSIAVDQSGSAYVTGKTNSGDFPTVPGSFDTSYDDADAFVVKFNSIGNVLIYATFVGGSGGDSSNAIIVDGAANAYITGTTWSNDFPTISGSFDTTYNAIYKSDAFIIKLNSAGSSLVYGTFLGGRLDDKGNDIALDGAGNVFVIGSTWSDDFPTTSGAFMTNASNTISWWSSDVFVAKLNAIGSDLLYATYLAGIDVDAGNSIVSNDAGEAYVTGETGSRDFPTTQGGFDDSFGGGVCRNGYSCLVHSQL